MEAHSVRRNNVKNKKTFTLKTILLSSIFLLFFFVGGTKVALAGPGDYTEYFNLFKWTKSENVSKNPILKVLRTVRPSLTQGAGPVYDFQFNFQGGFPILENRPDMSTDANWFWDHIYEDTTNSFIVRVCSVDTSGAIIKADDCAFTTVPNAINVKGDDQRIIDTQGNTESICKTDTNGDKVCTIPAPTEAWTKIYTKSAWVSAADKTTIIDGPERTDFNVIFKANIFKNIVTHADVSKQTFFPVGGNLTYKADIWYCGEPKTTVGGDFFNNNEIANTPNADLFNGLCTTSFVNISASHKLPFFKIAESAPFQITQEAANTATTIDPTGGSTTNTNDVQQISDGLPECGIVSGTIMGCVARIVYWLIYWPIAWFAGLMGSLFDFFMGYSLSDASYRAEFAVRGWQIVRDISNIFFIIILVWTGLSAVFNTSGNSMKKVVPQLILNALLINFSLFGTRVVIDVSNVVARVFYKSVEVCDGKCQPRDASGAIPNVKKGVGGFTPLSEKIVSAFNPQRLFNTGIIDQSKAVTSVDTSKTASSEAQVAGYFIIVSLIAAFILFAIAMMFWKTAFFFVGRVIGLYMAMIFAPFAVLTKGNMPLVGGIKELSWSSWLDDLTKYALLAPIFVFFLYVIYSFLETDFIKVYADKIGTTFFETVVYISIPMIIVYFMIKAGVGIAETYAGKIGKAVQGFAQSAAGLAGGVALGATGLMGGRLIGAAATRLNQSKAGEWLRDKGKEGGAAGWLARRSINTVNSAEKASFDFRKSTVGQKLFKEMGVDTDQKALSALSGAGLGFGTSSTAGGYEGQVDRYQKKQEAEAKLLESKQNQGDIDAFNDKNKKEYQDKVDSIIEEKMNAAYTKAQVDKWKTSDPKRYEQERQSILRMGVTQTAIAAIPKPIEKKSVQEMNAERKDKFAENLKEGSALDNFLGEDSLVGSMLGANTRMSAGKKAAKKISESTKIEKDLTEINATLKSGFREIVAMKSLRDNDVWKKNLTADQRAALMRGEKIMFTNKAGKDVEGGFYDFVKDKDSSLAAAVDVDVSAAENNKDQKKGILEQIKARQQFKFNFKDLNKDIKDAEDKYAQNPDDTNWQAVVKLKDKLVQMKNEQKKWQDLDKYIDEQKKKLEGKEDKSDKK